MNPETIFSNQREENFTLDKLLSIREGLHVKIPKLPEPRKIGTFEKLMNKF
jgi:hypothetical protein